MKILLIDNEPQVRNVLKNMVLNWSNGLHSIEDADGVASGIIAINSFVPDIVLLDVEMDDGSGFDLLKQIENPSFQLIFTTAHNKYALQALKASAIDYLLKPIDPFELNNCLDKAIKNIKTTSLQQQLVVLMNELSHKNETEKQIVLKDIEKTYFIKIMDILYCEAEGAYTKFYLVNSDPILVSRNLRSYEEVLTPSGFIRTHHSCLVNAEKIKIFDINTDNGSLILEVGYTFTVSQRQNDFVIQFLESKSV